MYLYGLGFSSDSFFFFLILLLDDSCSFLAFLFFLLSYRQKRQSQRRLCVSLARDGSAGVRVSICEAAAFEQRRPRLGLLHDCHSSSIWRERRRPKLRSSRQSDSRQNSTYYNRPDHFGTAPFVRPKLFFFLSFQVCLLILEGLTMYSRGI